MYQLPFISITVYYLRPVRSGACVRVGIKTPQNDNYEYAKLGVETTYF
jgi:hypothetical protein